MKVKMIHLAIIILTIILGGISATSALNIWKTTSDKIPVKFTTGSQIGQFNPDDIRGSYSFGDVSNVFEIPLIDLAKAFGVSHLPEPAKFLNKDLESIYGDLKEQGYEVGNSSVKLFVALYKGLPYELSEDSYLPKEAAAILEAQGNLSPEQLAYLSNHTISISEAGGVGTNKGTSENNEEKDRFVKGNTIFQEVLDWGLSKEAVEEIIGDKMPHPLTNIKDYTLEKGLAFSVIKEALQKKLDNLGK
jgi:hypothetical protein